MWDLRLMTLIVLMGAAVTPSGFASTPSHDLLRRVLVNEPNAHLQALAKISDSKTSLVRTYLSPAHKLAAAQLAAWMADAGMRSWVDVVGNVHGVIGGTHPDRPAILLGSHYDTVLDAGKYDGAMGIIVGIAAIKALLLQLHAAAAALDTASTPLNVSEEGVDVVIGNKEAELLVSNPLHLVAFCDEEGVRFGSTFLGSRAVAGTLLSYNMLAAIDRESGETLESILRAEGVVDPAGELAALALPAGRIAEYVEVHMEQGPVLDASGAALGVVSAIAGQSRMRLTIVGRQGHAGTVPMRGRGDALAAAAAAVSLIERRCGGGPGAVQGAEGVMEAGEDEMLVCTVGELRVWPGASNVIAGSTDLSIDIRAKSDVLRRDVVANVTASLLTLCHQRDVVCNLTRTHDAAAVLCDPDVVAGLVQAIHSSQALMAPVLAAPSNPAASCSGTAGAAGGDNGDTGACAWPDEEAAADVPPEVVVPVMVSGAGHDAMAIAEVAKMGMLFVRCGHDGISHSPLESVLPPDVAAATAALTSYLQLRASSVIIPAGRA